MRSSNVRIYMDSLVLTKNWKFTFAKNLINYLLMTLFIKIINAISYKCSWLFYEIIYFLTFFSYAGTFMANNSILMNGINYIKVVVSVLTIKLNILKMLNFLSIIDRIKTTWNNGLTDVWMYVMNICYWKANIILTPC